MKKLTELLKFPLSNENSDNKKCRFIYDNENKALCHISLDTISYEDDIELATRLVELLNNEAKKELDNE